MRSKKEVAMFSLHHWMYALAAFYCVLGVIFYRLARRPTCRLCFYRTDCPNRIGGMPELLRAPKCMASKEKLTNQGSHLGPIER